MADQRRPDLPPMRTNDVLVAVIGTAAWVVALVVLLIAGAPEGKHWWIWACVAGICIGLFGMWYIPRIQRSRDALLARNAARHAGNGALDNAARHADNRALDNAARHADNEPLDSAAWHADGKSGKTDETLEG